MAKKSRTLREGFMRYKEQEKKGKGKFCKFHGSDFGEVFSVRSSDMFMAPKSFPRASFGEAEKPIQNFR